MSTAPKDQSTDDFLEARDDWYAKGMPVDHPYAEQLRVSQSAPRPSFVTPLVVFG